MTEKKYELIEYKGRPARQYPNGVIRSERGAILHMPSNVAKAIQRAEQDIARVAAVEGMNEATGKDDYFESIKELFRRRTEVAMNDKTRAGNEALRIVLQHTGLGQERVSVTAVQGSVTHKVVPQFPKEYIQYLQETQAVEGEVSDE